MVCRGGWASRSHSVSDTVCALADGAAKTASASPITDAAMPRVAA